MKRIRIKSKGDTVKRNPEEVKMMQTGLWNGGMMGNMMSGYGFGSMGFGWSGMSIIILLLLVLIGLLIWIGIQLATRK